MKCRNCKMPIPRGAKFCPNCSAKQGTGGGTIALAVILVGGILFFIGRGQSGKNDNSNTQYADIVQSISAECKAVGISPSEIKNVKQVDSQGGAEKYQFSFENLTLTVDFNEDGSLKDICCGTNEMYSDGQAKIRYLNGFLVGESAGVTKNDTCTVEGYVLNVTGHDCQYAEITVGYFDSKNVKITSGIDNILNLKNNEQWKYKAFGFGSGIDSYKIESISWY